MLFYRTQSDIFKIAFFLFNQQSKKPLKDSSFAVMTWRRKAAKSSHLRGWKQQMFATLLLDKMTDTMNRSSKYFATNCVQVDDLINREPVPKFPVCWNRIKPLSLSIPGINDGVSSDGWALPNSDVSLLCLRCWKLATRKKQRRKILKPFSEQHGFKFPEYHVPDKSHNN